MIDDKAEIQRLPYRLKEPFLSTTELALFRVLTSMMGSRYVICPKVALNDLFYIVRPNENVHFFNKFFRKHIDFLLCDPTTMTPAFGVEVMKTISKGAAREADKFISDLFTDAGIPLVHITASERYDAAELVSAFQAAMAKIGSTASLRVDTSSDTVPNCPVCGKMMVLRIQRDGLKGRKYYGCMDSPRCAGLVPLD